MIKKKYVTCFEEMTTEELDNNISTCRDSTTNKDNVDYVAKEKQMNTCHKTVDSNGSDLSDKEFKRSMEETLSEH